MSEPLIPFAKTRDTGKVVGVDQVCSGINCGCVCLFCDVVLIARKGDKKAHHFAHNAREVNEDKPCLASFERAVFWMARTIFQEEKSFYIPKKKVHFKDGNLKIFKEYLIEDKWIEYSNIEFPEPHINQNFDTTIIFIQGVPLAVNLYYSKLGTLPFHGAYLLNEQPIANIAVDLSDLYMQLVDRKSGFKSVLKERVTGENGSKEWLYHPRELQFKNDFNRCRAEKAKTTPAKTEIIPVPTKEEAMRRFKLKMKRDEEKLRKSNNAKTYNSN